MQIAFSRQKEPLHKNNAKVYPIMSNGETKLTFQERFCLCNESYNRAMLKCCIKNCLIKWLHLDCVLLRAHSRGSWFCSTCKSTLTLTHVRIECGKLGNWTILLYVDIIEAFADCLQHCYSPKLFSSVIYLYFVPKTPLQFLRKESCYYLQIEATLMASIVRKSTNFLPNLSRFRPL